MAWITGRQYQGTVEGTDATFHFFAEDLDPNGMDTYEFYPELKTLKGLAQIKYWINHVFMDGCASTIRSIDAILADFAKYDAPIRAAELLEALATAS